MSKQSITVTARIEWDITHGQHKKYVAHVQPVRCWLCGKTSSEVQFRSLAHVVSGALGNRCWFTREECDGCNSHIGKLESDLVNSLSVYRIISRQRGKKPVTLKPPGSQGSRIVSLNGEGNILAVRGQSEESLVREVSNEKLILTVPGQAYKPLSICKVLTRLAMLLDQEPRVGYPHLIHWIRGELTGTADSFARYQRRR